jgi:hypothetical protein
LLQSAYSDYQIGPFENLHQLVENTSLVVLWARLKIFIQYSLRFAYRLKRQLLISHCFFPIKKWLTGEADREIKSALRLSHQFLFRCWDLYLVMAFLFRPKMWGRFAGSEAKKRLSGACLSTGRQPRSNTSAKAKAQTISQNNVEIT